MPYKLWHSTLFVGARNSYSTSSTFIKDADVGRAGWACISAHAWGEPTNDMIEHHARAISSVRKMSAADASCSRLSEQAALNQLLLASSSLRDRRFFFSRYSTCMATYHTKNWDLAILVRNNQWSGTWQSGISRVYCFNSRALATL
jgi:hypothetical protein